MTPLPHIHDDVPVLVAGAGPAGLVAAITLARAGIPCLVVERRREPSRWPRATVVSTGSMELLRSFGLEDAVRARGVDVDWRYWCAETLAGAARGHAMPTGLPSPEQSALISPTAPLCVGQDALEAVLRDHLRTLPSARLQVGSEVAGVDDRPDGVAVAVRDVRTGAQRTVHARHLLAADGGRSAVRAALGIAMRGPDDLAERLSVLFHAPLWDLVGEHRHGIYGVERPGEVNVFLPTGPGDRWLFGTTWEPARERVADLTEAALTALIREAAGAPGLRPRIERRPPVHVRRAAGRPLPR